MAGLPNELYYAGFSGGAASAQMLAATRPKALGVVLMHGALPLAAFGLESWPSKVPMQIHSSDADPWVDWSVLKSLARDVEACDIHSYSGSAHLFADAGLTEYQEANAIKMLGRVRRFVAQ